MQKLSTYMIRTLYSPSAQIDWHAYCQNSIIVSKWETILLNDRCDFFLHKHDNYYFLWLLYYCKSLQIFLSEFILYVYEWFFKIVLIWFNCDFKYQGTDVSVQSQCWSFGVKWSAGKLSQSKWGEKGGWHKQFSIHLLLFTLIRDKPVHVHHRIHVFFHYCHGNTIRCK